MHSVDLRINILEMSSIMKKRCVEEISNKETKEYDTPTTRAMEFIEKLNETLHERILAKKKLLCRLAVQELLVIITSENLTVSFEKLSAKMLEFYQKEMVDQHLAATPEVRALYKVFPLLRLATKFELGIIRGFYISGCLNDDTIQKAKDLVWIGINRTSLDADKMCGFAKKWAI